MKLVILDRDGVINYDSPNYIKSPEEWQAIPGSLEAIAALNAAGYKVAIASNQSGLGRGLFSLITLEAIHAKLKQELAAVQGHIDEIVICPHTPNDHCVCRKPLPGLLQQVAEHFHTDLNNIPVIGDSLRDIESAWAVQAQPILVLTGNGQKTLSQLPLTHKVRVFDDLQAAVSHLLR